jgi:hypothetical protein
VTTASTIASICCSPPLGHAPFDPSPPGTHRTLAPAATRSPCTARSDPIPRASRSWPPRAGSPPLSRLPNTAGFALAPRAPRPAEATAPRGHLRARDRLGRRTRDPPEEERRTTPICTRSTSACGVVFPTRVIERVGRGPREADPCARAVIAADTASRRGAPAGSGTSKRGPAVSAGPLCC